MDSADETRISDSARAGHGPDPFAPGTIVAGRYRIVAPLGRGGMGEVFRADDLKLGAPVALKFLPASLQRDDDARARLLAETRLARTISHPNVCRVYDVGDIDGRLFLTMEYIDGEDLASLLRRIGQLPPAKTTEIARQLCAGLSAAHERGVLHRDLKPSNVMIDGRGHARITDFGLAIEKHVAGTAGDFAGTVAYMSPERLHGAPATIQSDVYALGLILYEICTGKHAFRADTFEAWREAHDSSTPDPPSESSGDIDPALERVILRCLEKAPARRPSSAAVVAASLPGGDPLAAAIAAGETPSPELVAASGEEGTLPRRKAWGLLGATALSLAVTAGLWQWTALANLVPFEGSGDVLRAKARAVLRDLGYTDPVRDSAWWIESEPAQMSRLASRPSTAQRFADARRLTPTPLSFVYRQGPVALRPLSTNGNVTEADPAPMSEGDTLVHLDSLGRLTYLRVMPPVWEPPPRAGAGPDWAPLLRAAGLDGSGLEPAVPERVPPVAFDAQQAWAGRLNGDEVRFEAAAYGGRVVYATLEPPRSRSGAGLSAGSVVEGDRTEATQRVVRAATAALSLAVLVSVALLARHNLSAGRGDRRGARRVASAVLLVWVGNAVLYRHWIADLHWFWMDIGEVMGGSLFGAVFVWLTYLGLEPFARRAWPRWLIGWTRLLDGRWRDPLVGQGLLVGAVSGALLPVIGVLPETLGRLFELPGTMPYFKLASLAPVERYLANHLSALLNGALNGLAIVAIIVLLRFLLRSPRAVFAVAAVVAAVFGIASVEPRWLDILQACLVGGLFIALLNRFGLLSAVTALWVGYAIRITPWTFDLTKWFAWRPVLTIVIVLALALWGFRNVLGRQSAFPRLALD